MKTNVVDSLSRGDTMPAKEANVVQQPSEQCADFRHKFQILHTAQREGRPRPHKPAMLLAVLSLADNGELIENRIVYGPELLELFRNIFKVVSRDTDQCTPWNPFFYLKSEGFWTLHAQPGQAAVLQAMRNPSGAGTLMATVSHASLDDDLFTLIAQPASREALRQAVIDRYFSDSRKQLLKLCGEERAIGRLREEWRDRDYKVGQGEANGEKESVRSSAFSRTVRQAYDHRCAACGVRFIYESVTMVDAAHLVPFKETHDDSPQNGMALCKNHHWLMDNKLLSPGPGPRRNYSRPRWHVCEDLDDRIEGQRELLKLKNREVILPQDARLHPKTEALDRRMDLLKEACG